VWGAAQGEQQRQQQRPRGIRGATGEGAAGAGVALHAHRSVRPPISAAAAAEDAFGGGRVSRAAAAERSDGREGVPAAAAELSALLFSVWDEATPTLTDTGGPNLIQAHPDPQTRNPKLQTPNSKPQTAKTPNSKNSKLQTPNLKPFNPRP
jgi:hypothetical protein